jgi:hypothetical protein
MRESTMRTTQVDAGLMPDATVRVEASKKSERTRSSPPPAGGAVYGLGMIGALVYFLRTAESREDYVLAVGKAVVWPALLVFLAFRRLGG